MTTQGDDPSSDPVARTSRLGSLPVIGHVLGNPYLRHRDFVTLCSSSIFSRMGMSGEQVIIGILIYEITNSSVWVGIALALYYLPMLVFGLVSGVMADWMDRRVLIRRVELAVFINLIIFAALTALSPGTLWLVITFAVV
ncbi:MAG: hypothetical protein HOA60_12400, partial [Rhodospirillales bacterium]|nr:hypothetical protein [Rhodospirillales bacterium]